MYYEKGKLIFRRIFWSVIFFADVIIWLCYLLPLFDVTEENEIYRTLMNFDLDISFVLLLFGSAIIFTFFFSSLFCSCKIYYLNHQTIIVYAGYYHHYIKIDGEKYDEHNTLTNLTAIYLSTTLDDDTYIECTISTFNRIALKINGRLYKNKKR